MGGKTECKSKNNGDRGAQSQLRLPGILVIRLILPCLFFIVPILGLRCQVRIQDSIVVQERLAKKTILKKSFGIISSTDAFCRLAFSAFSQWNGTSGGLSNTLSGSSYFEFTHSWSKERITVLFKMTSELGYVYLWDSIFYKQKDEQTLLYNVSASLKKNWKLSLNSTAVTPLYSVITHVQKDSLGQTKWLTGGWMTPLKAMVSLGIKFCLNPVGNVQLGLSSLKMVYIHNQKVFDPPGVLTFHGIGKGKSWLYEYGISSTVNLQKELTPQLNWEFFLQVFFARNEPLDLRLKNLLSLKAGQLLNASIRTSVVYDKNNPITFQMENVLTIGFLFTIPK